MKIVWVCNLEIPLISEIRKADVLPVGGWLEYTLKQLLDGGNELLVFYHYSKKTVGENNNLKYRGFTKMSSSLEDDLLEFAPDVVHIWGTEFKHSLDFIQLCERNDYLDKTIVSIQGLVSVIGKYHYYAELPANVIYGFSLKDFLTFRNVFCWKKRFISNGIYEKKCIGITKNVIGRTNWDKICVSYINESVNYYKCNETLRESFYNKRWDVNKCKRHSVFFSQAHYPLKGFHMALEGFRILKKKYNDLKVFVVGADIFDMPFYKITCYQKYLRKLIKRYDLNDNIEFCGQLSEERMLARYLSCNVFVSSSSVENSSNSIGEAMLVGCPIIASYVGGVRSLLDEGDGYIYPFDEPYILAKYIEDIFESDELANKFSNNSYNHAIRTHNPKQNYKDLISIYNRLGRTIEIE